MQPRPFSRLALRVLIGLTLLALLQPPEVRGAPPASPTPPASTEAGPTASPTPRVKSKSRWHFDLDVRFQPENYDFFLPRGGFQNQYTFLGIRARPGLRYEGDGWQAYMQGQGVFLFGLPTNAVAPSPIGALGQGGTYYGVALRPDIDTLGIRQLYFRLGKKNPNASAIQVGRLDYSDGLEVMTGDKTLDWIKLNRLSKLVVGGPDYNTFSRTFDGVRADLDTRDVHFTGLIVEPTQLEPHFATNIRSVISQNFAVTFKDGFVPRGEGALFFNQIHDTRLVPEVDNRPPPLRGTIAGQGGNRFSTFGLHYLARVGSNGDAMVFAAKQSGKWGTLTHDAYAFIAELGWQIPKAPWKPWIRAGYRIFSGDRNPLDSRHQTWVGDIADPRNKYSMYTNLNLNELFGELVVQPSKKTTLRIDLRSFMLNQQADLWYSGAGVGQQKGINGFGGRPSGGSADVGTLLEVNYENRIDAHNLLRFSLGQAWGSKVVSADYPVQTNGHVFIVEYHYLIP